MSATSNTSRQRRGGFTLIELLVVVAIIALLISILLPSLNKARAQARATVCKSRIGQLCKSLLMYADDYEEGPPFLGVGFEDCEEDKDFEGFMTWSYWAVHENWLIPGIPDIWDVPEDLWPEASQVKYGKLFGYSRYENLYRCPDFERIPSKEQSAFNYTRAVTCRRLLSQWVGDPTEEDLAPGRILKMSSVYSPAALFMLLDEEWDYHVASNYNGQPDGAIELSGFWMGTESIHGIIGDCIGGYHGVAGKAAQLDVILAGKRGSIAFYDGHVDIVQDPLPYRYVDLADLGDWPSLIEEADKILGFILTQVYAQRGLKAQIADIVGWLINTG